MSSSKNLLLKHQLFKLNSQSIEDLLATAFLPEEAPSNTESKNTTNESTSTASTPKQSGELSHKPSRSVDEGGRSTLRKSYLVSSGRYRSLSNSVHQIVFQGLKLEEAKSDSTSATDHSSNDSGQSPLRQSEVNNENESDAESVVMEDEFDYAKIDPDHDEKCTIRNLVFRLAVEGDPDLQYVDDFLITYRYFVSAEDVARLLIIKYLDFNLIDNTDILATPNASISRSRSMSTPSKNGTITNAFANASQLLLVQLRIVNVFRRWVDKFICDFESNPEVTKLILDFLKLEVEKDEKKIIFTKGIVEKLEKIEFVKKFYEDIDSALTRNQKAMKRIETLKMEINLHGYSFKEINSFVDKSFLDLDEEAIARQLCVVEFDRFKEIRVDEFFHQAWNKKNAMELAPNLTTFIDWFNKIAYGVAGLIVTYPQLKNRTQALKKVINIAHQCLKLNNFNTAFEVMAGLNMAPISRLKKTWSSLPKKYTDMWNEISTCLSQEENHSRYRKLLKSMQASNVKNPIIPYVGLALTDLTFAEDGNPTYKKPKDDTLEVLANASVNFSKFRLIGTIIRNIRSMQTHPYTFDRNELILHWINEKLPFSTDSQLFEMSLLCEPRVMGK